MHDALHNPLTIASEFDSCAMLLVLLCGLVPLLAVTGWMCTRYRRCPANKVMVIYGKVENGKAFKCIHGGGAFVWPLIQDCEFLSLEPLKLELPIEDAKTADGATISANVQVTVQISTEPERMELAAQHLITLTAEQICDIVTDRALGQILAVVESTTASRMKNDHRGVITSLNDAIGRSLGRVGIDLHRLSLSRVVVLGNESNNSQ